MPVEKPLRILIADDEVLARQRLEDMLSGEEGIGELRTVENGREAVRVIREFRPDIVFLDVQMPGLTGIEVVREVGPDEMPVVIFVTAYDKYAVEAFEFAALDYLLKPFDDERFEQAFNRAKTALTLREVNALRSRLAMLFQDAPEGIPEQPAPAARYLERIAVEMRGQIRIVPVDEIDYITSSGPYAELHVGEEKYLIREQMQTLEDCLDPRQFFRIHRSIMVRLDRIEALLYNSGGDYAVRLKNGERLRLSRGRREELEQRLGIQTPGQGA